MAIYHAFFNNLVSRHVFSSNIRKSYFKSIQDAVKNGEITHYWPDPSSVPVHHDMFTMKPGSYHEVVIMTTSGAIGDDKAAIMAFGF